MLTGLPAITWDSEQGNRGQGVKKRRMTVLKTNFISFMILPKDAKESSDSVEYLTVQDQT